MSKIIEQVSNDLIEQGLKELSVFTAGKRISFENTETKEKETYFLRDFRKEKKRRKGS